MDFALNEEQSILQKTVRGFMEKECPKSRVRQLLEDKDGNFPELWGKMAALGLLGVVFPAEYGGGDGTFMDLVILCEEIGRNLCPSPFLSTVVLGGLLILEAGNEAQKKQILGGISAGQTIVAVALTDVDESTEMDSVNTEAVFEKGEYAIHGTKVFVPYAHIADYILCVAKTKVGHDFNAGHNIFIVESKSPGITCTELKTLSRDRQFEVVFDNVRVPKENIIGQADRGWPILEKILKKAAIVLSAEMVGGADAVLDMALKYAKQRVQFGQKIGSFQSIQHHLANLWLDVTGCRHLVYKAAWKVDHGKGFAMDSAMAKARAGKAYRRATITGHQILGAVSFTWEHDMHLYHRNSIVEDLLLGDGDFQKEIVAKELGL